MSNQFIERVITQSLAKEGIFLEDIINCTNSGGTQIIIFKYKFSHHLFPGIDLYYYGYYGYSQNQSIDITIKRFCSELIDIPTGFSPILSMKSEYENFIQVQIFNKYRLFKRSLDISRINSSKLAREFLLKYPNLIDFIVNFENFDFQKHLECESYNI